MKFGHHFCGSHWAQVISFHFGQNLSHCTCLRWDATSQNESTQHWRELHCLRWTATYLNSNFTITFCQCGSTSSTSISSPCDANLPKGTSEVKPRNVIQFPEDGYLTSNKIMTLREGPDPPSSQTTTESSPVSEGPKALASKTN